MIKFSTGQTITDGKGSYQVASRTPKTLHLANDHTNEPINKRVKTDSEGEEFIKIGRYVVMASDSQHKQTQVNSLGLLQQLAQNKLRAALLPYLKIGRGTGFSGDVLIINGAFDDKETWDNGYFENGQSFKIMVRLSESPLKFESTMLAVSYKINKPTFRKKTGYAIDVVEHILKWIISKPKKRSIPTDTTEKPDVSVSVPVPIPVIESFIGDAGTTKAEIIEKKRVAFDAKQAAKQERWDNNAKTFAQEAKDRRKAAKQLNDFIPFGQPILVGHHSEARHRRNLAKIESNIIKGHEAQEKADYYANKTHSTAIQSDDPDAINKLQNLVTALEQTHKDMIAINKLWRKCYKPLPGSFEDAERYWWNTFVSQIDKQFPDYKDCIFQNMGSDMLGCAPYTYQLQSNRQEIKRLQSRIDQLTTKLNAAVDCDCVVETYANITLEIDYITDRVRLKFPSKPSKVIRDELKSSGFHRSQRGWQKQISHYNCGQARTLAQKYSGINDNPA